jgi:hypothetical protein
MSDRKLTDAYWMELGAIKERAKILESLHQLLSDEVKDVAGDMDRARGIEMAIGSVKGDNAHEVTPSAEIEFGVAALELGVLRERERILALLEECFPKGWDYAEKDPIASVIALIKGENE